VTNNVSVRVGAPGAKQASTEVEQLHDRFTKLSQSADKWTKSGLAAGVGAGIALKGLNLLGDAVDGVTGFLGDSVHAYQNAEEAQARLTQSLQENVKGWHGNADAMKGVITASEKLGFTNTDTADSLALLVGATHDAAKATQMLSVAQDYARYKNESLLQAATDLTKVEGGSTRALKALGINLHTGATEAERMAAIMKVVGGQAQAYADTDLGKLAVAQETVNEAQVKFGQGLSHLEAEVLPAAADAVSGLADSLDNLTSDNGGYMKWVKSWAHLSESTGNASGSIQHLVPQIQHYGKVLDDLVVTLGKAPKATKVAAESTGEYVSWLWDMARAADGANTSISDLSTELSNDLFGKAERAGKEADLKGQISDLAKSLKDTKNARDATAIRGQIAGLRQELFDLHLEEAASKGPQAAIDFLKSIKTKSQEAKDAIQKLIEKYEALLRVVPPGTTYGGSGTIVGGKRLASGGVIKPGDHGTVGEDGIEDFEAVGGLVKITPRHKGSTPARSGGTPAGTVGNSAFGLAGGNGQVHVHVHLPNAYGMTPGQAEQLGRAIVPHITRAMQRSGHLAPARAF
jgi:hypothetical protein